MGFASKEIISVLNKVKPPYNINTLTQEKALEALNHLDDKNEAVDILFTEKINLGQALAELQNVEHIYPSDANFLLVKIKNASNIYDQLVKKSIIVRNRSNIILCENCLRISIGTPEENKKLLTVLREISR
jgi:histidinol-phosphate aminotransferase